MRNFLCSLYLIAGAFIDGKTKKISKFYLGVGMLLGFLILAADFKQGDFKFFQFILQMIPGSVFLLYSKITDEKIGYGDGLFLLILGMCLPYPRLWHVWGISLILIVFWAGYLWFFRKADKNTRIPFLPFLYLAELLLWGISYV